MKWMSRLKLMRLSKIAIVASLVFLVIFAGFTIYGDKVGNFVVTVDQDDLKLSLSMREDLSDRSSRLTTEGMDNQGAATYSDIPADIVKGIGTKNDEVKRYYLAFSFYLLNESDRTIDYRMSVNVKAATGSILDVVRLMVIEGEDGVREIYAKAEQDAQTADMLEAVAGYHSTDFVSDRVLFERETYGLAAGDKIKYTVVMWLEGHDPLCNDELIGSRLKLQVDFYGF